MHKRLLLASVLVFLVLIGLFASVFTNSIQRALTLPSVHAMMAPGAQATPSPRGKAATVMPTTTAADPALLPQNILGQDTFQRTNQSLWGTASDGQSWNGDANMLTNIFSVSANQGQIMSGQGSFNALLGPSATNMEVTLSGSLSRFDGTANLGVVLRYTDANNWYKALIDGTHLTLLKRANKQTTQLASVAFAAQNAQPYTLRFRVVGAMLFARAWHADMPEPGTWQLTATDSAFQSGQAGVRVVLQPGLMIAITHFAATTASSTI